MSYAASLARITWDPEVVGRDALLERIRLLGYGADSARLAEMGTRDAEDTFLRFFVAAVISMWVMWPTIGILYPAFARGEFADVRPSSCSPAGCRSSCCSTRAGSSSPALGERLGSGA